MHRESPSISQNLEHACFWTPWGTLITAEESWATAAGGATSRFGRLFELKNPTTAWGITLPLTPGSNEQDGDLNDAGEGLPRWASNGTAGCEFSGLYFDPADKRRAWVNIQHPASGNDRTIEITIPR